MYRIEQVLRNLIDNALKYSEAESIQVLAESMGVIKSTESVRISVIDDGTGIPQQFKDKIFEPFSKFDSVTSSPAGGSGLGLSICKQIVESLGGQMWLDSEFESGCRFSFQIPLERFNRGADVDRESFKGNESEYLHRISDKDILIVEDDEIIAELYYEYLKELGPSIDFAENGEECLQKVKSKDYDLILMDIFMPGIDGHQAIQSVRQLENSNSKSRTPAIAVSASLVSEIDKHSSDSGFDYYLTKPIRKSEVIEVVLEALFQRSA